jgi:hypothetical protein
MDAAGSSEMLVSAYKTTNYHVPENNNPGFQFVE